MDKERPVVFGIQASPEFERRWKIADMLSRADGQKCAACSEPASVELLDGEGESAVHLCWLCSVCAPSIMPNETRFYVGPDYRKPRLELDRHADGSIDLHGLNGRGNLTDVRIRTNRGHHPQADRSA